MHKTYLLSLLLIFTINSLAQNIIEVNEKKCIKLIQDKITQINYTLWQAVIDDRLTAYDIDSFHKPIPIDTLKLYNWNSYDTLIYDTLKTFIDDGWSEPYWGYQWLKTIAAKKEFHPQKQISGFEIFTKKIFDDQTLTIKESIEFIAPTTNHFVEKIYVGKKRIYCLKYNEVQRILNHKEFDFLNKWILYRLSLEGFMYPNWTEENYRGNSYSKSFNDYKTTNINHKYFKEQDTSLGIYIFSLPSLLAKTLNDNKKPLYKDSNLITKYNNIRANLKFEFNVFEDSLKLVRSSSVEYFEFYTMPFSIIKTKEDYIFSLKSSHRDHPNIDYIYFPYSSAKHYLKPFDRILLEALLEEALKKD